MPLSRSLINAFIVSRFSLIISRIIFVEQFPLRNQITFGGNPKNDTRLLKSLSFVTIVNPFFWANSHTEWSSEALNPISCKCWEALKYPSKYLASLGERFWSKSNFIRHKVQFFPCLRHSLNMREYLLFEDRENHQVFLHCSFLKPNTLKHHKPLFANPLYMVCRRVSRAQELFCHLVSW
jgi:hypothetical protein